MMDKERKCGTCRRSNVCGTYRFFLNLIGVFTNSHGVLIDTPENGVKAIHELEKFGKYCVAYEPLKEGEVVEIR